MNAILHPVARLLVALIFLMSGAGKIFGFAQTSQMMASIGFPAPDFFLAGAVAIEIIAGAFLLLGYKTRWSVVALVVFLIPATVIFHASVIGDPVQGQEQMINTLKNLAILGALIKFAADGAGSFALDNLFAKKAFAKPSGLSEEVVSA